MNRYWNPIKKKRGCFRNNIPPFKGHNWGICNKCGKNHGKPKSPFGKNFMTTEMKNKISKAMKKRDNSHMRTEEFRRRCLEAKRIAFLTNPQEHINRSKAAKLNSKKLWSNKKYVERILKVWRFKKRPSKREIFLEDLLNKNFRNEWIYTGKGTYWLGRRNPDFIHKNKKKIIELFGDYWHGKKMTGKSNKMVESIRKRHFSKFKFKTLIIWEHELKKPDEIIKKIEMFK